MELEEYMFCFLSVYGILVEMTKFLIFILSTSHVVFPSLRRLPRGKFTRKFGVWNFRKILHVLVKIWKL